jgi:hypothetical protein
LNFLRVVGKAIERGLQAEVAEDFWDVNLQLCPVLLKLEGEVERQSIWIWFHAKASTDERALASRERLLQCLEAVLGNITLPELTQAAR